MRDLCSLLWCAVVGLFRSRVVLQAEILVLRHQLNVLRRKSPKRVVLSNIDRVVLIGLYRLAPNMLQALKIITPETVIRWHRGGFRALLALQITSSRWSAKDISRDSPTRSGDEPRQSVLGRTAHPRRVAQARYRVSQTTAAKYMVRRRRPPSQGWKTFLRNHSDAIASIDMFVSRRFRFDYCMGAGPRVSENGGAAPGERRAGPLVSEKTRRIRWGKGRFSFPATDFEQ